MSGWTDTVVSDLGRWQADRVARRLRHCGLDAVYSSPLLRARATARAILGANGTARLVLAPGLREIFCGVVDGCSVDEVRTAHPGFWRRNAVQEDCDFRWPGGESYRAFRDRCVATVDAVARRHPGGRALVVTHAGVISQLVGSIEKVSPARWEQFRPGNASVSVLEWGGAHPRVLAFDHRSHLDALAAAG